MSEKLTFINQSKNEEMKLIKISPCVHKDRLWRHKNLERIETRDSEALDIKVEILTCVLIYPPPSYDYSNGGGVSLLGPYTVFNKTSWPSTDNLSNK